MLHGFVAFSVRATSMGAAWLKRGPVLLFIVGFLVRATIFWQPAYAQTSATVGMIPVALFDFGAVVLLVNYQPPSMSCSQGKGSSSWVWRT